jgi:hypothetical protein
MKYPSDWVMYDIQPNRVDDLFNTTKNTSDGVLR